MTQTLFDINDDPAERTGVMVCVTGQRSCERLIMRGAKLSMEREVVSAASDEKKESPDSAADGDTAAVSAPLPLYVVHCVETGQNFMNTPYEADAIDYLFTCAQVVGAELTILRADSVEDALAEFAEQNKVGVIVMGASPETGAPGGRFAKKLAERLPGVEFDIVGGE